jgi:hypothetical protein
MEESLVPVTYVFYQERLTKLIMEKKKVKQNKKENEENEGTKKGRNIKKVRTLSTS